MVDLILDIQHGESGTNDTLILVVGVFGTLLNAICLLFNLFLAFSLFRARKELARNPFYDFAPHLILSEAGYQAASLAILAPCMLLGTAYRGYYLATLSQRYIDNGFLLIPYECYYYLQFLLSLYRFVSVGGSSGLQQYFEKRALHLLSIIIWLLCLGECVYEVLGPCMRVFRPRYHSTLVYCFDETRIMYNLTGQIPVSWWFVQSTTMIDTILPLITLIVYAALYVKIGLYTMSRTGGVSVDSLVKKLWIFFRGTSQDSKSRKDVRIVQQGFILLLFLSVEPAWNIFYTYHDRPVSTPLYILGSYYCIYMHVLPNFITFIAFNKQTRSICTRQMMELLGRHLPKVFPNLGTRIPRDYTHSTRENLASHTISAHSWLRIFQKPTIGVTTTTAFKNTNN